MVHQHLLGYSRTVRCVSVAREPRQSQTRNVTLTIFASSFASHPRLVSVHVAHGHAHPPGQTVSTRDTQCNTRIPATAQPCKITPCASARHVRQAVRPSSQGYKCTCSPARICICLTRALGVPRAASRDPRWCSPTRTTTPTPRALALWPSGGVLVVGRLQAVGRQLRLQK